MLSSIYGAIPPIEPGDAAGEVIFEDIGGFGGLPGDIVGGFFDLFADGGYAGGVDVSGMNSESKARHRGRHVHVHGDIWAETKEDWVELLEEAMEQLHRP